MAGVRHFIGSSSAITASVKGTPCRSSSGAPSIWYFTSYIFGDARGGIATVEGLPEALTGGSPVFCLLVAREQGLPLLPLLLGHLC
ncbi:UNVERIFIED_CONTAM: hypothetical protein Slati_2162400 [Sesamum latifolium]|uniref:Uncharacterized protein n=1 Tax=Sesamum latifolium TaxID=2727402 RepID=A0AAW2WRQ1_9LAMI